MILFRSVVSGAGDNCLKLCAARSAMDAMTGKSCLGLCVSGRYFWLWFKLCDGCRLLERVYVGLCQQEKVTWHCDTRSVMDAMNRRKLVTLACVCRKK